MELHTKSEQVKNYISKIHQLASELNSLSLQTHDQLFYTLLNSLNNIDKELMKLFKLQCQGHMLFTRHGQSNNWAQKTFGINPNSQISEQAIIAMDKTNQITRGLFLYPQSTPVVRVSPMVRAKQTATLILPSTLKYDVKIEGCLTQNSSKPSGAFIVSLEQLTNIYEAASFLNNPKKVISYKLSEIFYSRNDFYHRLQTISSQTDHKLKKLTTESTVLNYFGSEMDHKSAEYSGYLEKLTKQEKVQKMKKIVDETFQQRPCDLWFIGHSKSLRSFFKRLLGVEQKFQFCETRRVYKITNKNGEQQYFIPPYNFIIDQQNGKIRIINLGTSINIYDVSK